MDPKNLEKQRQPEEPRFLSFPHLPEGATQENGTPALNRWSSTLTTGHNFPGAQVSKIRTIRIGLRANMDCTCRPCCMRQVFPTRKP